LNGWGGLIAALPSLAQSAASIYATSRQPSVRYEAGPSVTPATFTGWSPYLPTGNGYGLAALPAVRSLPGPVVRGGAMALRGAASVVGMILAKAGATIGRRISLKQAVALARRIGPQAAAVALGISLDEMYQLIAGDVMKHRRRRGITGRQISNARSTIRRMTGFMARVQEACGPATRRVSRRMHRAGCGCVVCRRAS